MQPPQIFTSPPSKGFSSSDVSSPAWGEELDDRYLVSPLAFANAFRSFSLSCIALVQKRLVYNSTVSGERSVAGDARNLGFEIVWLGKRIFLTAGGNG
jgi:hypothetical protein